MNLATEQFKLPFESGEPLIGKILQFHVKEQFDKMYVLSIDDFLARGEVIENAFKNTYLIKSKQARDIDYTAKWINYETDDLSRFPDCFGIFLGKFIPTANRVTNFQWRDLTTQDLVSQSREWGTQFFENQLDYWCLFLVNQNYPNQEIKRIGNKPCWVKFSKEAMLTLWKTRYEQLRSLGLPETPSFELEYTSLVQHYERKQDPIEMDLQAQFPGLNFTKIKSELAK